MHGGAAAVPGDSQDFIVRSDITIITNVREDHQEEMGETLEEIADSMSVTIPRNGVLITAESRPHLQERLRRNAEHGARGWSTPTRVGCSTRTCTASTTCSSRTTSPTGFAVADLLNIDRRTALRGMWKSVPDVGVVRLLTYDIRGKRVLWVPMFAANDRESVIAAFEISGPTSPRTPP